MYFVLSSCSETVYKSSVHQQLSDINQIILDLISISVHLTFTQITALNYKFVYIFVFRTLFRKMKKKKTQKTTNDTREWPMFCSLAYHRTIPNVLIARQNDAGVVLSAVLPRCGSCVLSDKREWLPPHWGAVVAVPTTS